MDLIINTDGASRGNPGLASYGYVIRSLDGVILHQEGHTLGKTTNNIAEYNGVLKALEYVRDHFSNKAPHNIKIVADSMLIVKQLAGFYKVKHPGLKPIFDQVKGLEIELGQVSYTQVPRAQNFIADKLANQAIDRGY